MRLLDQRKIALVGGEVGATADPDEFRLVTVGLDVDPAQTNHAVAEHVLPGLIAHATANDTDTITVQHLTSLWTDGVLVGLLMAELRAGRVRA